jgi:3-hydroxyacyl-CoA dehydrogenase/enoyl-CoA hydratase/carnithine racemase
MSITADLDLPDEVVTESLVRYFDFPTTGTGTQTFALITLDNAHDHTRPSTFGPAGLRSLDRALAEIEARSPAVSAVGVTGKPFVFAVGADLSAVGSVKTRDDAVAVARAGHAVFARLKNLTVPTFALINGAVMGGGLELALHCDYRALSSAAAAISFPEVFLGLVPGWGGTQLLPNLIGAAGAVEVIIGNALNSNAQLRPGRAAELGIVDVVLDPADFLSEAVRWAAAVLSGAIAVNRPAIDRGAGWDEALATGRQIADARLHGAAPAPYRALELLELARTATFEAGTAAEDDVLADLIMTDELRSGLYAFDLVNRRAKRPVGAPDRSAARQVGKVGVIGAGLMASQLALLFARQLKVPVVLTDVDAERLAAGVSRVHGQISELQSKRRLSVDAAQRLQALVTGSTSLSDFADADFIIEAVFEDLAVKKAVFAELEQHIADTAVLATNTSSLSVSAIAADLQHPERVVGLHFFNPVAVLPLVEVVKGEQTDDASLATAFSVAKTLRKSAVLAADRPAFIVNRLLTRLLGEVIAAVDEGTPLAVADAALDPLGLPMSPLELLGLVGPAIGLHVATSLHEALGARFGVSENLRRVVQAGKAGVYVGSGADRHVDPDVAALFQQGDAPSTAEQVRSRALAALADEIALMLDEKVIAEVADIDLCMLLGAGWPFHLGGISPYLDRTGISKAQTGARFLPVGVASV